MFLFFSSLWLYRISSNTHFLFLHLEFLGFSAHFEQLSNGVHKALEVMVAHLLNFTVVVADPPFQFIHEESMFLSIINRPSRKKKRKKNRKTVSKLLYIKIHVVYITSKPHTTYYTITDYLFTHINGHLKRLSYEDYRISYNI